VANGGADPFDGDLDDYARWLATAASPAAATSAAAATPAAALSATSAAPAVAAESADTRKQRKRAQAQQRAAVSPLRAAIAEHERKLEHLSAERQKLEQELGDVPDDAARVSKLLKEQARVAQSIAAVEAAWMKATEQLELASANSAGIASN